jgi:iron-sulfur cluster assembly protein
MEITLTEKAAHRVQQSIAKRGAGIGLRLGVRTAGCSGLAYTMEFADQRNPEDHAFESRGVTLLVDRRNLPYLAGTELDFVREGMARASSSTTRTARRNAVAVSFTMTRAA